LLDLGDVVVGDQPAVGDPTDPSDREPPDPVLQHPFEGGGVASLVLPANT
jgi:hypothetical protein